MDEFLFCYEPFQIAQSKGFWTFKHRDVDTKIVQGLPSPNRIWKDKFVFVCGDTWERLPQEDPRDFVKVRRSWGTPSSSGVCFSSNPSSLFFFRCCQCMTCSFLSSCSVGSSTAEFGVEGEDIEDLGD